MHPIMSRDKLFLIVGRNGQVSVMKQPELRAWQMVKQAVNRNIHQHKFQNDSPSFPYLSQLKVLRTAW
jgi:hypothetical protein